MVNAMIKKIEQIVKPFFHSLGLDFGLHYLSPRWNDEFQLYKSICHFDIEIVLDIGANTGQFAKGLYSSGYRGRVVSFEPLADAYDILRETALSNPLWTVHPRTAIGNLDGSIEINISQNSVSSSILPILESHTSIQTDSKFVGKEKVPIIDLYVNNGERFFIKIDTQGYEWQVLEGAQFTLSKAKGIMLELSLVPLYETQHLWIEMISHLESQGFSLWGIQKGFTDNSNGRGLQIDAIFFRVN